MGRERRAQKRRRRGKEMGVGREKNGVVGLRLRLLPRSFDGGLWVNVRRVK